MNPQPPPTRRSWPQKFRDAFRGMPAGVREQSSFAAHFAATAVAIAAAAALRLERMEWYAIALCITLVLTAEMFNSALESMARAITGESNPHLGNALDIASAAVLTASLGASLVGVLIFGRRIGMLLGWW